MNNKAEDELGNKSFVAAVYDRRHPIAIQHSENHVSTIQNPKAGCSDLTERGCVRSISRSNEINPNAFAWSRAAAGLADTAALRRRPVTTGVEMLI